MAASGEVPAKAAGLCTKKVLLCISISAIVLGAVGVGLGLGLRKKDKVRACPLSPPRVLSSRRR
jgi:hypothetical protein